MRAARRGAGGHAVDGPPRGHQPDASEPRRTLIARAHVAAAAIVVDVALATAPPVLHAAAPGPRPSRATCARMMIVVAARAAHRTSHCRLTARRSGSRRSTAARSSAAGGPRSAEVRTEVAGDDRDFHAIRARGADVGDGPDLRRRRSPGAHASRRNRSGSPARGSRGRGATDRGLRTLGTSTVIIAPSLRATVPPSSTIAPDGVVAWTSKPVRACRSARTPRTSGRLASAASICTGCRADR